MPLNLLRNLLLLGLTAVAGASVPKPSVVLHTTRLLDSDLEITGLVAGLQPGQIAYIRYADLRGLPLVRATIGDNPDYPGPPLHVAGVSFPTLAAAVGALPQSDLIDALCSDRYRSHFPAEYVTQHHPILVLTIDGKRLDVWAKGAHHFDPGPYVVMYAHFVPAFRILTHVDRPQLPDNIIRLNFSTQAATFGALAPHGNYPPGSPEQIGFTIAKQNCLRCHFLGPYGGTKSGRSWQSLSIWAREQPAYFQAYIHNPQAIEPHSHMEGSPEYDAQTLAALTAYFRTFTAPSSSDPTSTPAKETHR
jgi:hypothetical protein